MTCRLARYRGRIDPCRYNTANPLSSRPTTKELATEAEWRDPEAVSSPMPIQGISTRTSSPLIPYARFAGIDRSLQVTFPILRLLQLCTLYGMPFAQSVHPPALSAFSAVKGPSSVAIFASIAVNDLPARSLSRPD